MKLALLALAFTAFAAPALAAGDGTISYGQLLRQVTKDQPLCFGREYSAAHLERNPRQQVKQIRAKIVKDPTADADYNYVEVNAVLKGEKNFYKFYRAFFSCSAAGDCWIDCDGGRMKLAGNRDGSLSLTNLGFVLEGGCGEETEEGGEKASHVYLEPTKGGDDLFRLERLPSAFCQI